MDALRACAFVGLAIPTLRRGATGEDALLALVAFAVFAVSSYALIAVVKWKLRRGVAERLRAIDEGRRCPACNAPNPVVRGNEVRCVRCGRAADLGTMSAATFDPAIVDELRDLPRGSRDGPR